ncbi:NADH-quinone oxidoreductase subunit E [Falsiphaeobacter marinintestinus]|uniref:NADH-quinone oxidoreductase subunit E n=1 Tax=Falsiphaeobacter marinintestinus TaxID=1492905 RepID=UPI0011B6F771|nr:NADH-quinone oxidoreductase subunit E [Phaeobacter marinintestinus]
MLRRLHPEQPESFEFTPTNQDWARAQISKYPEGRQASAVIPLLWRAQEQEGWLTKPALERVGDMLGMAYIRVLEVASFYFMFQLKPVGSVANIQICGTTTCMICGAEDLMAVCKEKIAPKPHMLSDDGKFSWEEVECLGSCANAPMAQIGKDYYEDLTVESFSRILDDLAAGKVPLPGPQNGRFSSEPLAGLSSLKEYESGRTQYNASVALANDIGDTIKRIDGTEVPILTPWLSDGVTPSKPQEPAPVEPAPVRSEPKAEVQPAPVAAAAPAATSDPVELIKPSTALAGQDELSSRKGTWKYEAPVAAAPAKAKPATPAKPAASAKAADPADTSDVQEQQPLTLTAPRDGKADDLKLLKGVGPKLENLLHEMGFYHFDQVAAWTPAEVSWVDNRLTFKGRIERDGWIEQAKKLASGEETDFAKKAKDKGLYD